MPRDTFQGMRENIAKNGPATSDRDQAEVFSLLDNPAVVGVVLKTRIGQETGRRCHTSSGDGIFRGIRCAWKNGHRRKVARCEQSHRQRSAYRNELRFSGDESGSTRHGNGRFLHRVDAEILFSRRSKVRDRRSHRAIRWRRETCRFGDATSRVSGDPPIYRRRFGPRVFCALPKPDKSFSSCAVGKTGHQVCREFAPRSNQRLRRKR